MPATEATWRDMPLMHRIFAVTGVLLTIATVWMFWKDHRRSWKRYQVEINQIDLKMNALRQAQYETADAVRERDVRQAALAAAKAQPLDERALAAFLKEARKLNETLQRWRSAGHAYSTIRLAEEWIQQQAEKTLAEASKARAAQETLEAAEKEAEAALAALQSDPGDAEKRKAFTQAENRVQAARAELERRQRAAARERQAVLAELEKLLTEARAREDKALGIRKFKAGELDAAKANVDLAIRDGRPPEEIEARQRVVRELEGDFSHPEQDAEAGKQTLAALTAIYQSLSEGRRKMEQAYKQLQAEVDAAQKRYDESVAELERLRKQQEERQERYFFTDRYPWIFGKGILTLPILDAFNSPRKIDNLWSEGLTQDYNHARVRRFDRCTTCHQSLAKTQPGQPTTPAYVHEELLRMVVVPPTEDARPKPRFDASGQPLPPTLEEWLGLTLASEGLLDPDDATVAVVVPRSPAARAVVADQLPSARPQNGLALRQAVATDALPAPAAEGQPPRFPLLPGLMLGDVIVGINGKELFGAGRGPKRVEQMLLELAQEGKPIELIVRRGLPNPYIGHPRLDLYVSDTSPHRMQLFGCTICHEGQGSATSFEWASHTPNTQFQMRQWVARYGWFDNPHWIYPMFPKRFAESACLKCHHEVVELEASDRFPDPPAPKLTYGYHLIRKYGCYGCHEINGYDGPSRRIGPDLRSEPNYFAVAQQIIAELRAAQRRAGQAGAATAEEVQAWKDALADLPQQLTAHPEQDAVRQRLRETIEQRVAAAGAKASRLDRTLADLANMLRDVEVPGRLRRPGPSLRFLASKLDPVFLYDWLANPQHFRPSTRMPRFFGLWDHLPHAADGSVSDPKAPRLEPIEIRGMIEYFKQYAPDQVFEPLARPAGIAQWTTEEKIARGKTQFQVRGCLACHSHKDFPEVEKYRGADAIVQGPDLSAVGTKFSPQRNPQGPDWLYSWIKQPTRYHARTVMPDLFLEPELDPGANPTDPSDDRWYDPVDDIVTYLLASSQSDWQPIPEAQRVTAPLDAAGEAALKELALEYLNKVFYKDAADSYYVNGIPAELEGQLKGAEKELVVPQGGTLTDTQRLVYIGRQTISKYGCFGCHDIPGFEDAKPIGTGLADWGRKDPAKLAFEHITHYVTGGHGRGGHASGGASHGTAQTPASAAPHGADRSAIASRAAATTEEEETREFYVHALEMNNRIGFIYQKLKEPRSYDFEKTENKSYNDRLRMPQFPLDDRQREAIITFVLGLVADPPQPKYLFRPEGAKADILAGKQVLETYNCGGCHILGLERWEVRYNPGDFGPRPEPAVYPYLKVHFSPKELEAASRPDRRNELHATLKGLPPGDKNDGLPLVFDLEGGTVDSSADYAPRELKLAIDLFEPTIVDGSPYYTGQSPVAVALTQLDRRYPSHGGALTKYLLPEVTRLERQANPNASGAEAYGWLPPPLIGEGKKVQTGWLHDFLLEPYPIRPAVFLRMPRFNMSSEEATKLANYFAAVDGVSYPYAYAASRDRSRLAALEARYVQAASAAGHGNAGAADATKGGPPPGMRRLDDAMKIVVNGNFCVKCHLVGDYSPPGSKRALAPNLAEVYRRLRPEYVRDWIANPKMILPYTSMPVNIPFEDPPPVLAQLYHGTNVEQVEALTDLLMNFDEYARAGTRIADRVQPATPEAAASAEAGSSGSN
jgi:hypothetical protein